MSEELSLENDLQSDSLITDTPEVHVTNSQSSILQIIRKTQTKIQKRREVRGIGNLSTSNLAARNQKPKARRYNLLPKDRLLIPTKNRDGHYLANELDQTQPLVSIPLSDDDSDEFDSQLIKKMSNKEIKEQLIKDGYNLDAQSDDEDLDLIPPRPLEERLVCCNYQITCTLL